MKDPQTGRRISKLNPPEDWVVQDVLELRIVEQQLWDEVKARQKKARQLICGDGNGVRSERARRPVYLLSGLIRCGECGGGFVMAGATHYACNNARNKGTCQNSLSIRRDHLEAQILEGLRAKLMAPELLDEFIAEFHRELNRLRNSGDTERLDRERDLRRVEKDIRAIIESIKAGFRSEAMRLELEALEEKKRVLTGILAAAKPSNVRFHPNLAKIYRSKIDSLRSALDNEETRTEAANILRGLIDEIRLVPNEKALRIHLVGHLAELLSLAQSKQPGLGGTGLQVTMVAGVGFEPTTFRL